MKDASYPDRFVPKTFRPGWTIRTQMFGRFVPQVWTFRTQGLVVSYSELRRFVPKYMFYFSHSVWSKYTV